MASFFRKYPTNTAWVYILLLLSVFIQACGVRRVTPKNAWLLKKNVIKVEKSAIRSSELSAQILHRANKRILLNRVPFYLWMYAFATKRKNPALSDSTPWRKNWRNEKGEPPVLLDTTLVHLSADNIRNYLFNKGYFDADVWYKFQLGKRKAKVKYRVHPGKPYLVNSFFRQPKDSSLLPVLDTISMASDYFRLWWPADLNKLGEARNYLAREMRNRGYYLVNPTHFRFEIDTLNDKKEAKVVLMMDNPENGRHELYRFGHVRLFLECSDAYMRTRNPDSVHLPGHTLVLNRYPIHASTLNRLIRMDSGALYSQAKAEQSYTSLAEMGLFSIVDIRYFTDTPTHTVTPYIYLKALPRMFRSLEPQGLYSPQGTSGTNFQTQNQRSFGLAGILSFNNRNLFGNGENFRLSSVTSYEAIVKRNTSNSSPLFGFQQGFNAQLSLPHFNLLDNLVDSRGRFHRRNTVLSLSYQFENNPNFRRSSLPASLSLQFIKPKFSFYYTPLEVSYNRNRINPVYKASLPQLDQDFVNRVFVDQFISAAKTGFIYANNRTKPGETYFFTRAGFETSGNLHRLIRSIGKDFDASKDYKFLGVNYFQYAKMEGEIRLRQTIDALNTVILRVNSGVVLPYGNSSAVPYDKRYFIGGSNSLRAWRPRRLGPGNTPDTTTSILDRSGEFLFESNFEYRFTLIGGFLESALFFDMGNIWNLNHKGQSSGTKGLLAYQTLGDELALNTGLGFRFDFKFFLFRIDWGVPIRDPGKAAGSRWMFTRDYFLDPWDFAKKETALAIGIGYPF
ncbi:MAG: BamA/TamA family outer membrane protein [Bacteroidetes bacterium]|nr:BamA/TamA family outer membrane protein [Bacteroidota bacterium]